jgi:hypothetical protein
MFRLIVMYNLAPETNEAEYVAWRTGEHQRENSGMPGVLRTDFARTDHVFPEGAPVLHKYVTTADFPDMASLRAAFYSDQNLADMKKNWHKLHNPVFMITEILVSDDKSKV